MVKIMENPIKMDDSGGNIPIFGNTHIVGMILSPTGKIGKSMDLGLIACLTSVIRLQVLDTFTDQILDTKQQMQSRWVHLAHWALISDFIELTF